MVAAAKYLVEATENSFVVPNFVAVTKPFFPWLFKPATFQEKGFIVSCESVRPDVYCRSEDTGRKVTFST